MTSPQVQDCLSAHAHIENVNPIVALRRILTSQNSADHELYTAVFLRIYLLFS